MKWQNGLLVCGSSNCIDVYLLGFRETAIVRVLEGLDSTEEALPVKKLTEPNTDANDLEQIIF